MMAAYDVVGLLGMTHGSGRGASPLGYIRMAASAANGGGAVGARAMFIDMCEVRGEAGPGLDLQQQLG
jgi:hypothetical protein